MKLVRFGNRGCENPGILDSDGIIRDLTGIVADIGADVISPRGLTRLADMNLASLPVVDGNVRLGPCVAGVGKLMCIGLNYKEHVREAGMQTPAEPVLFGKFPSALAGANDNLVIPHDATKTDWEVELAVVIGSPGKYIPRDRALSHVAGYCVVNDVSERAWQLEGTGQWVKGKSGDGFAPTGPWLVTTDEITDPQNLDLWLDLDGERRQNGNTRDMVFPVDELISYLSRFFTLYPGDIISTGTPPGVGMGHKPEPEYLHPGQILRLGVTGLGEQVQHTIAEVDCNP
ncbi:MAG TPA: FAA hydrolase family protein [Gammaproteobacteria bacterium]|nr:FAA hydrolase family protein [Gammaproteobacteria bacterium]